MKHSPETEPNRVLHVSEAGGGVARHLRLIVPSLRRLGIESDVVLSPARHEPGFAETVQALRDSDCRVNTIYMRRMPDPLTDLPAAWRLRQTIHAWKPEVIHAHATKAGLLARLPGVVDRSIPVVYSPHAFFFERFRLQCLKQLATRLERVLAHRTDRYVFVSEGERAVAGRHRLPVEKASVIENSLPTDFGAELLTRQAARAALDMPDDSLLIAVVGRFVPQKGHGWLLESLEHCRLPASKTVRVLFIGTGPCEEKVREQVAAFDLETLVQFPGYIPSVWRYMRAFDLAIVTSRYEGLAYTILEYLAAGVPFIASDIPANFPDPEMRQHVPAVPLDDVHALRKAIESMLHDSAKRTAFQQWAPAFVQRRFNVERQTELLADCYRSLRSP